MMMIIKKLHIPVIIDVDDDGDSDDVNDDVGVDDDVNDDFGVYDNNIDVYNISVVDMCILWYKFCNSQHSKIHINM